MSIASSASLLIVMTSFLASVLIVFVRSILVFGMLVVWWIVVVDVWKVWFTSFTMVAPSAPSTSSFIKYFLRVLWFLFLFWLGPIFSNYRKSSLLQLFELIWIKTNIFYIHDLVPMVIFIIILEFTHLMYFRVFILSVILSTFFLLAPLIPSLLLLLIKWTLLVLRASLPFVLVSSLLMLRIVLSIFSV